MCHLGLRERVMDRAAIELAQALASIGGAGILALFAVLWVLGKIHSEVEFRDMQAALEYREKLRAEAIADRKAADDRVDKLVESSRESNALTRRSLDLNERLIEEFVRPSGSRTRRADRGRPS